MCTLYTYPFHIQLNFPRRDCIWLVTFFIFNYFYLTRLKINENDPSHRWPLDRVDLIILSCLTNDKNLFNKSFMVIEKVCSHTEVLKKRLQFNKFKFIKGWPGYDPANRHWIIVRMCLLTHWIPAYE